MRHDSLNALSLKSTMVSFGHAQTTVWKGFSALINNIFKMLVMSITLLMSSFRACATLNMNKRKKEKKMVGEKRKK